MRIESELAHLAPALHRERVVVQRAVVSADGAAHELRERTPALRERDQAGLTGLLMFMV